MDFFADSMSLEQVRKLDAVDVLKLAMVSSPKLPKQIREEMGWSEAHMRRICAVGRYYPSFEDLRKFCVVVGNDIVAAWIASEYRLKDEGKEEGVKLDCTEIIGRVACLFAETGEVGQAVQDAVADNVLEAVELRRIIRELQDVIFKGSQFMGVLRAKERELVEAGQAAYPCGGEQ